MLSAEQTKQIEEYSVWRERQRYSDEQLWERLLELYGREVAILKQLPSAYQLAHGDLPEKACWRRFWLDVVTELEGLSILKEGYVWHLTKRGDQSIAGWIEQCEAYRRANSLKWQRAAWGIDDE